MTENRISMIAAIGARTRALGKNNDLLFKIPEDLARFRAITRSHPVIMGRKTWESLPEKSRPLPGRDNIVVTRAGWYEAEGAEVVHSLPEALSHAKDAEGSDEIFIIGGGELYSAALPFASRLYLTLVDDDAEGDVFFPEYPEFTNVIEREEHSEHAPPYEYVTLER